MSLEILAKDEVLHSDTFKVVKEKAEALSEYMNDSKTMQEIETVHRLNSSSQKIQNILIPKLKDLGFETEKKGLFLGTKVSGLRPDYFCKISDTGIILEVERGKTLYNNMDLLDLWKCHICEHAKYLFLVVPKIREKKNGSPDKVFHRVKDRISLFFDKSNYINVDAVFVFGY